MGEWSKSIGEEGERITKFVFEDILEFNSLQENISTKCIKGEKHKTAEKDKTTHGIDGLIYYESPVEDNLLDIVLISSKYTLEYAKYPKSDFKSHIKDLAFTLECFKSSKIKSDINYKFNNVNKTDLTGILVWLSNDSEKDYDIISKIKNTTLSSDLKFDRIIILDNQRVNFLYESIFKIKQLYGKENVDFVYHNSGLNFDKIQRSSFGKIFPLNYLYSDIIVLRVFNKEEVVLQIFINDDFSSTSFSQILSFAKTFDQVNAAKKIILNYKNYDSLRDQNIVKDALVNFKDYIFGLNLSVKKFPSDFRSN